MSRRRFIGGNWKCAAKASEAAAVTDILNRGGPLGNIDVVVFPSALHLTAVAAKLRGDIAVGSQNVHCARGFGAFTGEHTPELLADSGIRTVLVGHSERRHIVGECEALCGEKARVALAAGFTVVFCVGETLADREKGKTMTVVTSQLSTLLCGLAPSHWDRIVIAYEPVWAIGTGKVASPAQVAEVHAALRRWLATKTSPSVAAAVRIIYGGSVKASNCAELVLLPDVDGFLVGGASVKPEFLDILRALPLSKL